MEDLCRGYLIKTLHFKYNNSHIKVAGIMANTSGQYTHITFNIIVI